MRILKFDFTEPMIKAIDKMGNYLMRYKSDMRLSKEKIALWVAALIGLASISLPR